MTDAFDLHPRLAADTHFVVDLPLSRLLLMDDRRFPWLVLVPRCAGIREFLELSGAQCAQLVRELRAAGRALERLHAPHKLNVATLGNIVSQFHLHVVARHVNDAAWPAAPFGVPGAQAYTPADARVQVEQVRQACEELLLTDADCGDERA